MRPAKLLTFRSCVSAIWASALVFLPGQLFAQETFVLDIDHPERPHVSSLSLNEHGEIMSYELPSGEISLAVGQDSLAYSDPLVCFDFSDGEFSGPKLKLTDPNGHVIGQDISLTSGMDYLFGGILSFRPATSVQCFYSNLDGKPSLFGASEVVGGGNRGLQPTLQDENDLISYDQFAGYSALEVNMELATTVSTGVQLAYSVTIKNSGKVAAENVSIQELMQSDGFDVGVDVGHWACDEYALGEPASTGACPEPESAGDITYGPLRLEGLVIPAETEIRITFGDRFIPSTLAGASLDFHVVAVDGPGKNAPFATDSKRVGIE